MVLSMHAFHVTRVAASPLTRLPALGHIGVDIFFVISGFIITKTAIGMTAADSGGRLRLSGVFALHRVARIYPLFWVVLAVSVALHGADEIEATPVKLLLLRAPAHTAPVSWTLSFELYFYLVASLALLIMPRRFAWALAIWAVAQAIFVLVFRGPGILRFPLSFEFGFGAAAALLVNDNRLRRYGLALSLSAIGFVGSIAIVLLASDPSSLTWRVLWFGVPAALLLYGLVGLEVEGWFTLPVWLQRRGTESYSLYLWHLTVIKLVHDLGLGNTLIEAAIAIPVSLAVAFVSYHVIERPFIRAAHSVRFARPAVALT
jgi:exopolysaccharide production protein ExoZ